MTTAPQNDDGRIWPELRRQSDLLIEVRTLLVENIKAKDDHEARLRKLEERKFPLPTVSVILATAALAVTILTNLIGR